MERACAELARICYNEGRANEIAPIMEEARRRSQVFGWPGSESMDSVLHDVKRGRKFNEA